MEHSHAIAVFIASHTQVSANTKVWLQKRHQSLSARQTRLVAPSHLTPSPLQSKPFASLSRLLPAAPHATLLRASASA